MVFGSETTVPPCAVEDVYMCGRGNCPYHPCAPNRPYPTDCVENWEFLQRRLLPITAAGVKKIDNHMLCVGDELVGVALYLRPFNSLVLEIIQIGINVHPVVLCIIQLFLIVSKGGGVLQFRKSCYQVLIDLGGVVG